MHSPAIQLPDPFDLLQGQLEQFLLADDVEMAANAGIFTGKALNFRIGEMAAKSHVQLAREVVVELREKLDVQEEDRRRSEFVGYYVEEDLGAVVLILLRGALFGSDSKKPHPNEVGSVTEEDALSACMIG